VNLDRNTTAVLEKLSATLGVAGHDGIEVDVSTERIHPVRRMLAAGKLWLPRRRSFSGEIQRVALQVGELDNFEGPFVCCRENHTRRCISF